MVKLLEFQHFIPSIAKNKTNGYLGRWPVKVPPLMLFSTLWNVVTASGLYCWFTKVGKIYYGIVPYDLQLAPVTASILKPNTSKEMISCWFTHFLFSKHILLLTICNTSESFSSVYQRMHRQVVIVFN